MYKEILQSIDNVAIWPVVSFAIFFLFFLLLLWWTFTANKQFLKEMSNKPLEDSVHHEDATKFQNHLTSH